MFRQSQLELLFLFLSRSIFRFFHQERLHLYYYDRVGFPVHGHDFRARGHHHGRDSPDYGHALLPYGHDYVHDGRR